MAGGGSTDPSLWQTLFGGGGGTTPLTGTDPISQWGGYSGSQINDAWRGAQGGMSGTDPIPQWGGYTGNQIGNAWQQAQQPQSLWDRVTKGLGTIDPAKLKDAVKDLGGPPAAANPLKPPPAQTANPQYPAGYFTQGSPLDPKQALLRLMRGY